MDFSEPNINRHPRHAKPTLHKRDWLPLHLMKTGHMPHNLSFAGRYVILRN